LCGAASCSGYVTDERSGELGDEQGAERAQHYGMHLAEACRSAQDDAPMARRKDSACTCTGACVNALSERARIRTCMAMHLYAKRMCGKAQWCLGAHTSAHTRMRTHMHTCTHVHTHAHIHARTQMHAYTHAHVHASTHARTHMHAHTHAHARAYHVLRGEAGRWVECVLLDGLGLHTKQMELLRRAHAHQRGLSQ